MILTSLMLHRDQRVALGVGEREMARRIREALDAYLYPDGVPADVVQERGLDLDSDDARKAVEMRGQGMRLSDIASALHTTRRRVQTWLMEDVLRRKGVRL